MPNKGGWKEVWGCCTQPTSPPSHALLPNCQEQSISACWLSCTKFPDWRNSCPSMASAAPKDQQLPQMPRSSFTAVMAPMLEYMSSQVWLSMCQACQYEHDKYVPFARQSTESGRVQDAEALLTTSGLTPEPAFRLLRVPRMVATSASC